MLFGERIHQKLYLLVNLVTKSTIFE